MLPRRYTKTILISLDCLRDVLSNIDPKSYSTKKNIYDAIRSFTKYLIAKGLADPNLSSELQKIRPKRLFPSKRLHCSQDDFEKLLKEAGKRYSGQSDYDVLLNKLFVYLGKGKKNGSVGICNRLYDYLVEYLKVRTRTNLEQVFLTKSNASGELVPLTRKTLFQKVKRLSKRIGIEVNVHGLRRTFATVAANSGKPINIISLALVHADLKTTQGYLITTQDEVIREMQRW